MDSLNSSVAKINLDMSFDSLDGVKHTAPATPDHAPLVKVMTGDSSGYVETGRYDPQAHESFKKMSSFLDQRFGDYQNFGLKFSGSNGENLVLFRKNQTNITAYFTNCNGSTVGQAFTLHNFDSLKVALDEHVAALSPKDAAATVLLDEDEFNGIPDEFASGERTPTQRIDDAHVRQTQVKWPDRAADMQVAGRKIAAVFSADTARRLHDGGAGFRAYLGSIGATPVTDAADLRKGDAFVVSRADAVRWSNHAWIGVLDSSPTADVNEVVFSDIIDLNGLPLVENAAERKCLASMPNVDPQVPGRDLEHLLDAKMPKSKLEFLAMSGAMFKLPAQFDRTALLTASRVVADRIEESAERFLGPRNNCNHVAHRIIKQAQSVYLAQKRADLTGPSGLNG